MSRAEIALNLVLIISIISISTRTPITMKFAINALLNGSAAAFAPTPVVKTVTSLNAFESELGAQAPSSSQFLRPSWTPR